MAASMAGRLGGRLLSLRIGGRGATLTPVKFGASLCPSFRESFRRCLSLTPKRFSANVSLRSGTPTLSVLLPSQGRQVLFPLPLFSLQVSDLIESIKAEDGSVEKVQFLTMDGEQFAGNTSMTVLLQAGFQLVVGDVSYSVSVPEKVQHCVDSVDTVKGLVQKLHGTLSIAEQQHTHQANLQARLDEIKEQLVPMESRLEEIAAAGRRRVHIVGWGGLALMSFQAGFLGRLTWWEYSWDIMEPVTYFVTFGTAIIFYAYYVVTREDFANPTFSDRQYLFGVHGKLKSKKFDIDRYNKLKEESQKLEATLENLQSFPAQHGH